MNNENYRFIMSAGIDMNGEVANKEEAIDHLVDLMVGTGNISDKLAFKKVF